MVFIRYMYFYNSQYLFAIFREDFLIYFTDFSYFSVRKKFQKLQDTVRSGEKLPLLKGSVSAIFSYRYFIFYSETSLNIKLLGYLFIYIFLCH